MPSFSRTGLGSLQETETDSLTSASDLFAQELVETSVISRKNCIARPNKSQSSELIYKINF